MILSRDEGKNKMAYSIKKHEVDRLDLVSVGDIKWAAGFLEGEGYFGIRRAGCEVSAAQVNKEPVERLKNLFGGWLNLRNKPSRATWKPSWLWLTTGPRAVGIMMTLYCLLSVRRQQQTLKALNNWKVHAVATRYRTHCKNGHGFTVINTHIRRRGGRVCKICRRNAARIGRGKHRKRGSGSSEAQLALQF